MIEKQSTGLERAERGLEVNPQVAEANVLDHPNAGDLVVTISLDQRAIVTDRHTTFVGEPGLPNPLLCERRLILAERYPRRVDAVVLGGVHNEAAPTTANVEQTLAGLEAKLATDQIELRFLRDIERVIGGAEIGARINHPAIEPELIEVVSDVVVKADRCRVAHRRMSEPEVFCAFREARVREIVVGFAG